MSQQTEKAMRKPKQDEVNFWIKMFAPRTKEWLKSTRQRLRASVSIFETEEENRAKVAAIDSLLK